MPYIDTSVWIDFSDYDDEELIDALEDRGYIVSKEKEDHFDISLITELYKDYTAYGYTDKFKALLEEFFKDART